MPHFADLRDLAALSAKAQQLHEEDAAADGGVAGAGVTMKAAGDRLDEEQAALNKRRCSSLALLVQKYKC
jgi:hypothetical protein